MLYGEIMQPMEREVFQNNGTCITLASDPKNFVDHERPPANDECCDS